MRISKFLILLIAFFILPSFIMMGQKLLVLEKAGTVKNYKYKVGDEITVETKRDNLVFSGSLTGINDSTIVVENYNEIKLAEISRVLRKRELMRIFSGAAISAGVFYFSLDALNGIINNDSPVIAESTLIATGALLGSGLLMKQFVIRKIDLEDKWRLKILDFSFPAD